ncbi:hypothetical protein T459_13542 [Capsicum annuum]|uniref:Uncharacterized protein n=1 Tax=Capsicum annuum TaxID=4072 RepID=A0A2G2ZSZ4_CAPAN|nr:hypothetical protein T459_13542 [Capsicum annuum]
MRATDLSILENISFTTTNGRVNNENNSDNLGGNNNGNIAFTVSFWLVKHPSILEGPLVYLSYFLLESFNDTLVNDTKLVDQVTNGGRLSTIDIANDNNAYVNLPFTHDA